MSESTPFAIATLDIERPVDVVDEEFFDVEHALRDQIYHGITLYRLAPGAPGEQRLRQEIKIFSRIHLDDVVVERAPDGAWVKRFVEGPNTGARFVARFVAAPNAGSTRARVEAFVPSSGFTAGMGKLSSLGLEKVLHKILSEHRRALEGYQPAKALRSIDRALEALRSLTTPLAELSQDDRRAVASNILEAAHVVAVADGDADAAERDAMQAVAAKLLSIELDDASCDRMVRAVAAAVAGQGLEARCDKIGGRLKALGVGELGVAVATLVAEVSHGIDPTELAAIERIAAAAGVSEEAWMDQIRRIDEALAGPLG